MIKRIIIFVVLVGIFHSCSKDFDEVKEPKTIEDVSVNSIYFSTSSDCYIFVHNSNPYIVLESGYVYLIDEQTGSTSYKGDVVSGYNSYDIVGPVVEMNGGLYVATERDIRSVYSGLNGSSTIYTPSSSLGEIVSFSVVNDIGFICYKNGSVYKVSGSFSTTPSYVITLPGSRVIETGGKYYLYSEDKVYSSNDGNTWSYLASGSDIAALGGKSNYGSTTQITGIVSNGAGKLLVSYRYNGYIYTDLLNESLTSSTSKTKSSTYLNTSSYSNSWVMGESILLDGGTFFNFGYDLYTSSSSYYTYPGYRYNSSFTASSASLDLNVNGAQGVVHSYLNGCIAPIKHENKIYTYNKANRNIVIVSE